MIITTTAISCITELLFLGPMKTRDIEWAGGQAIYWLTFFALKLTLSLSSEQLKERCKKNVASERWGYVPYDCHNLSVWSSRPMTVCAFSTQASLVQEHPRL